MNAEPSCPTCGGDSWEIVGRRSFSRANLKGCPPHRRERLRVLFDLWLPGVEPVTIEDIVCENCGLVIFRPRPAQRDLEVKYQTLHKAPSRAATHELTAIERRRSRELWQYMLACGITTKGAKILDYGGFRGALMHDLARSGADCHVLDYAPDALPGISKLGATLDDLPATAMFDVIVCSHVLEHVPEPRELCAGLLRHLAPDGMMYVEVPMEILGHPPRAAEPVTHINFFSVPSLQATLELAGLRPTRLELAAVTGGSGDIQVVVRSVAHRAQSVEALTPSGHGRRVVELITISMLDRARLYSRQPELLRAAAAGIKAAVRRRARGLARRTGLA